LAPTCNSRLGFFPETQNPKLESRKRFPGLAFVVYIADARIAGGVKMLRLAIIGFGGYGWSLVEAINHVSVKASCRLVGAADSNLPAHEDKMQELIGHGVAVFDSAAGMLTAMKGHCDAVYIATGIGTHRSLTIAAAGAGYHVHLEKPPCATVQELLQMRQALEAAGRMCIVGFQGVHSQEMLFLKQAIVAGKMGKVGKLSCKALWPRDGAYYGRNDWAGKLRDKDGAWVLDGPATNALAHQIMNMLLLASDKPLEIATPVKVRAELYAGGPVESHDTAAIEIFTRQGPVAYFLGSHCTREIDGPTIQVWADKAKATWSPAVGAVIQYSDGSRETHAPDPNAQQAMVENFVGAIRSGDRSLLRCDLQAAGNMVRALDGAHESSGRIHRIGPRYAHRVKAGTPHASTIVDGLDEVLCQAADQCVLPSDLPCGPPWAVRTGAFDLAGYASFPTQFVG
jgi:predicted dehydrogenase